MFFLLLLPNGVGVGYTMLQQGLLCFVLHASNNGSEQEDNPSDANVLGEEDEVSEKLMLSIRGRRE